MNPVNIRTAQIRDIDGIFEVLAEADQLHRDAHPEIFRPGGFDASIKKFYRACIMDPAAEIFIAEQQTKIVGAILISLQHSPKAPALLPRKFGVIENIAVHPSLRETGIGQALMKRAQQWAAALGASSIELTVWAFNQGAMSFYEKIGYKTIHHKMRKDLK